MIIARAAAALAITAASFAWYAFAQAGLVLSHYDARAHLVVARRIVDNITPGWQQFGGVWLPLPHILNVLPAQNDLLYRTGAFASFVSLICFGVTTYAVARLVYLVTSHGRATAVAAALVILNPNLLYLHVTPLTEPLLLAATTLATLWLCEWVLLNQEHVSLKLGVALFAAVWTRYEAWPVVACGIGLSLWASFRLGASRRSLWSRGWRLAAWPVVAVVVVLVNSRITTGAWFVASGFFVPDPTLQGRATASLEAVARGASALSTRTAVIAGIGGALAVVIRALLVRADAVRVIPLALFGAVLLPWFAFYQGHPFRIRYGVPAVVACALFSGVAVGTVRKQASTILGGFLVGITLVQSPPWRSDAPLIVEASWDLVASRGRERVTACLVSGYAGEKILASMGSLAHYMHELAGAGLDIADFIHEGNGVIWELAMETGPAPHAGWMLVEEVAEGGDTLARRIRAAPAFAAGMTKVCEGGGVGLYRLRTSPPRSPDTSSRRDRS